ncbi:unnamed protein product [Paramecium primaurelia]|uniref:Uncharacterized protein n=1 Tax=Paramecium primaurelia TaxID=5886 RepID=A0A8S1NEI7_PARPR|nr:unnamed protein product [Paramecium primaurelia]
MQLTNITIFPFEYLFEVKTKPRILLKKSNRLYKVQLIAILWQYPKYVPKVILKSILQYLHRVYYRYSDHLQFQSQIDQIYHKLQKEKFTVNNQRQQE